MSPTSRVLAVLALALATPLAAAEAPQASGSFAGREWTFEPRGAYAFPAEVGMDDEPGIRVAVSNAGFIAAGVDRYYDRQYFIDTFFRDAETLVVYFDFSPKGEYKGMSYYFGSGDGCGYCYDGSVVSTVKIAGGRAKGSVKLPAKEGEAHWDVTFDVPVASGDFGAPLPAGGGEPGAAYAAYHAALGGESPDAVKPFYTEETQAAWAEDRDGILSSYRKDHPDKGYKVVRGWSRGDRALLLVEGENAYMNVSTEVHLVKEKGTWRIDNEMLQAKLGG
jgi:hypothetical protein